MLKRHLWSSGGRVPVESNLVQVLQIQLRASAVPLVVLLVTQPVSGTFGKLPNLLVL